MNKPYGLTKIREDKDGRKMLGGGCKTCPVTDCATSTYRGSACASLRATYGLGDPMTNADRIRSMSDEELAKALYGMQKELCRQIVKAFGCEPEQIDFADEAPDILEWLKQPYKENEE